ncbi:flagellar basal body rod protein FlgB [Marinobacterium zhoushanense]|uniref:Flagellar basal body rod protein FlgB n=1 Tax=Marinobacterium zhoushanense TaxID=1679163 RepID=A0ABQ1KTR3_9GAMM|nr:flagellar basal body rod protein FlgB [Marinobacterium zhoushanense]GGC07781.1 flagellar basal body rod protein FlgB [Marinobacterium zhoushanense]
MAISFESALGIHDDALLLRARRAEVLANNIANADTPGFKARDIDFASILHGELGGEQDPLSTELAQTQAGHAGEFIEPDFAAELMFRTPSQPSVDGNTVEVQEEMARYSDNAIRYQSSFTMLNSKFKGLVSAIKGE